MQSQRSVDLTMSAKPRKVSLRDGGSANGQGQQMPQVRGIKISPRTGRNALFSVPSGRLARLAQKARQRKRVDLSGVRGCDPPNDPFGKARNHLVHRMRCRRNFKLRRYPLARRLTRSRLVLPPVDWSY